MYMAGEGEWSVTDLTDMEHQIFPHEVRLAREMLQVLTDLERVDVDVRVPRASVEYIENTLSEWFEIVGEIEKRRGNMPYLIDRGLYSARQDASIVAWNQGLTLDDIGRWLGEWGGSQMVDYPFIRLSKTTQGEDPLSGYINRLLPVKFVLRILAILTLNSEAYDKENGWQIESELESEIALSHLREVSSKTATYASKWLKSIDDASGSSRGSEVATGFPTDEKSRERFVTQFVGSSRKKELSGAIFDMGFANISSFMGFALDEVRFTPQGWDFAMLPNPLLDGMEGWKTGKRFSDNEISFLLNHFKSNVKSEWNFKIEIMELIGSGMNRPQSLEEAIIESHGWEKAQASVRKNGVLSRMQELELIDRTKEGREVTYHLTESGKELLNSED